MARIAMSDEDKLLRRGDLVAAAHRLFRRKKQLPTVADIAKEAGIAKGTVYLYFSTKEEIFIALLEDDFSRLLSQAPMLLDNLPSQIELAVSYFAQLYCQAVQALPNLLPLAAISNGVLEQNLPFAAMTRFKLFLAQQLATNGQLLEQHFPQLPQGAGASLLLRTYALTLGLWQTLSYPPAFLEQLSLDTFKILKRDFNHELQMAVKQLWLGALQTAQADAIASA